MMIDELVFPCAECGEAVPIPEAALCAGCGRHLHPRCGAFHNERRCSDVTAIPSNDAAKSGQGRKQVKQAKPPFHKGPPK